MDKVKGTDPTKYKVYIQDYDEIPNGRIKSRTWYKYLAKIGTTCGVIIWADKAEVQVGDTILYMEDSVQVDKTTYPSSAYSGMGIVDRINDEGRLFINKW